MGHTTGLYSVRNRTDEERSPTGFSIVKLEWLSTNVFIAAGTEGSLQGDVLPWAETQQAIRDKAFLLRENATSRFDGTGAYYLFQDENGYACWTAYNSGNPSYEQRVVTLYSDFGINLDIHVGQLAVLFPRFAP
jgi:hypothetical protein